jgi:hypothetical protein
MTSTSSLLSLHSRALGITFITRSTLTVLPLPPHTKKYELAGKRNAHTQATQIQMLKCNIVVVNEKKKTWMTTVQNLTKK